MDQRSSSKLGQWVEVEPIGDVVRRSRLRWYGHVERKTDDDWVKGCARFSVEGSVPPGGPKKTLKTPLQMTCVWLESVKRILGSEKNGRAP